MSGRHDGKFLVRKLLAALSAVFLLCGAAAADIVYTTSENYTAGALGVISSDLTTPPSIIVPGLNGDAAVFSFRDGAGKPRVAIIERLFANDGDRVWIYDTENWNNPLFNLVWPGAINIYGMAASDNMLYVACHNTMYPEEKQSKIVQVSMPDYKLTGKEYAPKSDSDGFYPHTTRILAIDNNIYALFLWEKNIASDYAKSKLVKLTANLEFVEEYDVGPNAVDMVAVNDGDGIVVAYMGGPQAAGTVGGLDIFHTGTGIVEHLPKVKDLDQMIAGVCYVNPLCMYFIGQSGDWPYTSKLYKWTGTTDDPTITKVKDISSTTGSSYQVAFDAKNEKIVTLAGNEILIFNLDKNEPEETFTTSDLGGSAYFFALTDSASGGNSNSESSSGCNAGLTAAFLVLAVLPLGLRKTRGKNR
jgi:Synergist-CTERM protein sorting domain-containing protein